MWNWNNVAAFVAGAPNSLLIEPCGIEIWERQTASRQIGGLLIEPCGIEISWRLIRERPYQAFNRTLWNWNLSPSCPHIGSHAPFNRTLWNWNRMACIVEIEAFPFNRTLWNWNPTAYIAAILNFISFNRTLWNWNLASHKSGIGEGLTFNRTLWNWNRRTFARLRRRSRLLIEPCGIEMKCSWPIRWSWFPLLIEPCGIEMLQKGVETEALHAFNRTLWNWNIQSIHHYTICLQLLIEPCGLEMKESVRSHLSPSAFNRTLWNWNEVFIEKKVLEGVF